MDGWHYVPSWKQIENHLLSPFPSHLQTQHSAQAPFCGNYEQHTFNPRLIPQRLKFVDRAFFLARTKTVRNLHDRFADIDLNAVIDDLISTVTDMAMILVGAALTGAAIGGGIGALGFGAGALPGAIVGASLGAQAGTWILAILGLQSIAEFFLEGLPTIIEQYLRGIKIAWEGSRAPATGVLGGMGPGCEYGSVHHASTEIASAHTAVILLLLSAIVAYLTRGRGEATLLASQMSNSHRGGRLAQWMLKHEERLKQHPDLQPREPRKGVLGTPEQSTPSRRANTDQPSPKPKVMPLVKVPCFSAANIPSSKIPEFDRQLAGQEKGLNNLTVAEYLKTRVAFKDRLSVRDPRVAKEARIDLKNNVQSQLFEKFRSEGLSPASAMSKASEVASEKMKKLAALHNPDLYSGGKDVIGGFGDRQVNSSIGAQWRSRVSELDKVAGNIAQMEQERTKINTQLKRCK